MVHSRRNPSRHILHHTSSHYSLSLSNSPTLVIPRVPCTLPSRHYALRHSVPHQRAQRVPTNSIFPPHSRPIHHVFRRRLCFRPHRQKIYYRRRSPLQPLTHMLEFFHAVHYSFIDMRKRVNIGDHSRTIHIMDSPLAFLLRPTDITSNRGLRLQPGGSLCCKKHRPYPETQIYTTSLPFPTQCHHQ